MDSFNLQRFLDAQNKGYCGFATAYKELSTDHFKQSHWMWYIFPQLKGLGFSRLSEFYGIDSLEEAKAYIQHPILGPRLIKISSALLEIPGNDPELVMGYPDDLKLQSCMTLFDVAASGTTVFRQVLDKYYHGVRDQKTLDQQ